MEAKMDPNDPRFEQAIELFNAQEFFACHDALEEIWSETLDENREFFQGLIHVAVSLFHFGEENLSGARKMHDSAVRYLSSYGSSHLGIDLMRLRTEFDDCFAELLVDHQQYPTGVSISETKIPQLHRTGVR